MVTAFGQDIISLIPGPFRVGPGNGATALLGDLCSTCKWGSYDVCIIECVYEQEWRFTFAKIFVDISS